MVARSGAHFGEQSQPNPNHQKVELGGPSVLRSWKMNGPDFVEFGAPSNKFGHSKISAKLCIKCAQCCCIGNHDGPSRQQKLLLRAYRASHHSVWVRRHSKSMWIIQIKLLWTKMTERGRETMEECTYRRRVLGLGLSHQQDCR